MIGNLSPMTFWAARVSPPLQSTTIRSISMAWTPSRNRLRSPPRRRPSMSLNSKMNPT
jgi:hypothetical protein